MSPPNWALKAHALLLPTPLAAIDPDGEPAREAELRERLGLPHPTPAERAALDRAARRAEGTMTGLPPGDRGLPLRSLVHPLDPRTTVASLDRAALLRRWPGWLQGLPKPEANARGYRALWHAVMDPTGPFARVPDDLRLPDYSALARRSLSAALIGAGDAPALLLLGLGPVQETIEASRRTADLWCGSFLFSYLCAEMLMQLAEALGPDAVLSPWPRGLALVERHLFGQELPDTTRRVQPSLPAKVLALVPADAGEALAEAALRRALSTWLGMGRAAHARFADPPSLHPFEAQLDAFLERDAALLPWPAAVDAVLRAGGWPEPERFQPDTAYGPLSGLVWQGLSAAKKARLRPTAPSDTVPKCTSCGERDQLGPSLPPRRDPGEELRVYRVWWRRQAEQDQARKDDRPRESLQLADGEGLCAVCWTRRFAPETHFAGEESPLDLRWGDPDDRAALRYPSLASVASAPWRYRAHQERERIEEPLRAWADGLKRVNQIVNFTPPGNGLPGLRPPGRTGDPLLDVEGSWLDDEAYLPERAWRDHVGRPADPASRELAALAEALRAPREAWRTLCKELNCAPSAYVAALYLDGDQMSAWLNGSHERFPTLDRLWPEGGLRGKRALTPALQAELSRRLGRFATDEAPAIVHAHLGRLVYCGGDDVVALLPLGTALSCALALRQRLRHPEILGPAVSASAGLAIAHARQPMRALLRAARAAEKAAKVPRDALALSVEPRSGAPLRVVLPWEHEGTPLVPLMHALLRPSPPDEQDGPAASRRRDDDLPLPVRAVYALREELPGLLGGPEELWRHRVTRLLGGVPEIQALAKALDLNDLSQLLLILAFLAREDRGVGIVGPDGSGSVPWAG